MKELADALMVAAPTATTFVARLVDMGWAKRENDPSNRRLVRLHITPKGRTLLGKAIRSKMAVLGSMVKSLSNHDQRELARIYQKLIDASSHPSQ